MCIYNVAMQCKLLHHVICYSVAGIVEFPNYVSGISISVNQLAWSPPDPSNGIILYYNVKITSPEQELISTEKVFSEFLDLQSIVMMNGDYLVEVYSENGM